MLSRKLKTKTPAQVFREIDEDGNGLVSLFNLSNYLAFAGWKVDKEQVLKVLKVIDFNRDGNVSLPEFKQFIFNDDSQQSSGNIDKRQMDHFVSNVNLRVHTLFFYSPLPSPLFSYSIQIKYALHLFYALQKQNRYWTT